MPSFKTVVMWAATSLARVAGTGTGRRVPVQQIAHLGKASQSIPWFPYGFDANVPVNELALLLNVLGSDSKAHLPGSPGQAPETSLGEVVMYHPASGAKVHFLQDGSILVEAGAASVVVNPSGGIDLVPGSSPVTVDGDLVVTGSTTLSSTVTSGGKDISDTHTHTAGTYLDSLAAPVTGVSGPPT